ncbi:hypothetical protein BC939DRAFT_25029 [Gamsiella multidivaricata]|uniref:uncharacterized protein n=1 Tax=Gamsiella multidivaricata TaxID=101098 RepID=UPI00221EF7FC|nr:uncharacterized protein BC939DRAFT_25029 [Gamsiella multidivaricata]KAI7829388.1 hypothetical protein BC939DRAFT_25029 [Gamsiella multidivaricata]
MAGGETQGRVGKKDERTPVVGAAGMVRALLTVRPHTSLYLRVVGGVQAGRVLGSGPICCLCCCWRTMTGSIERTSRAWIGERNLNQGSLFFFFSVFIFDCCPSTLFFHSPRVCFHIPARKTRQLALALLHTSSPPLRLLVPSLPLVPSSFFSSLPSLLQQRP